MNEQTGSRFGQIIDWIEETSIATCMGLMTLITFANVVVRYVFNSNILWALELTVFLFAWLVLMGASYGVKKHLHIGVDVVLNMVSPLKRRILASLSVLASLTFAILLLIGSWNYWYPFATEQAWYETEDLTMPEALRFIESWVNECGTTEEPVSEDDAACRQAFEEETGDEYFPIVYEKVPRYIPYLALPLGMALLTLRFLQLGWRVATGEIDKIITSHEVEEELEEAVSEEHKYMAEHKGKF
jgi:C4-dicarboxylate transporter DctQ subunit